VTDAVFVVDGFAFTQLTVEHLLHDESMLEYSSSVRAIDYITVCFNENSVAGFAFRVLSRTCAS
jgi:hypothetical protein